jgi:hypothetical protein
MLGREEQKRKEGTGRGKKKETKQARKKEYSTAIRLFLLQTSKHASVSLWEVEHNIPARLKKERIIR